MINNNEIINASFLNGIENNINAKQSSILYLDGTDINFSFSDIMTAIENEKFIIIKGIPNDPYYYNYITYWSQNPFSIQLLYPNNGYHLLEASTQTEDMHWHDNTPT